MSDSLWPHGRRKWQPTPVLSPGKFHGWRRLVGYSPWGCKELDITEQLHSLYHQGSSWLSCHKQASPTLFLCGLLSVFCSFSCQVSLGDISQGSSYLSVWVRGTMKEGPAAEPLPSEMQLLGERLVNAKSTGHISYLGVWLIHAGHWPGIPLWLFITMKSASDCSLAWRAKVSSHAWGQMYLPFLGHFPVVSVRYWPQARPSCSKCRPYLWCQGCLLCKVGSK